MSELYHGSSEKGITRLEPHKSTHGNFVYATPYKELAIIFSARCGDDYTYSLSRNDKDGPWVIVERIPEAFNLMFSNNSSIYTLDDTTFKDIHTGFAEVVSEVGVNTNSEEYVENVYDAIKKMASEGKVQLYTYPNKPKDIPIDSSDLIDKEIKQQQRNNKLVTKESFERLILLHPCLIDKVNQKMKDLNLNVTPYKKEDIIELFENAVIKQNINPETEQYLKSIIISVSYSYPELLPILNEKLSFLDKSKPEKISILISKVFGRFLDMPPFLLKKVEEMYLKDNRSFSEIGKEMLEISKNIRLVDKIINGSVNYEVMNDSILLIGSDIKTDVSKRLSELTGLSRISLDDKEQLSNYYQYRDNFKNLEDFEFYLISSVLTSINEPTIIDFGSSHFMYNNPLIFYMVQKIIKSFKNVELLLSSENGSFSIDDNNGLFSNVLHIYDMELNEITDIILTQIQNNKNIQGGTIKK